MKKNPAEIEIFVPGRICLFGEHSDWAGVYRRINSQITPGNVVIAGTNQGIFARSRCHKENLVLSSRLSEDQQVELLNIPMDKARLKEEAESESVFCYAAGVAYYMLEFYGVGGIEIDNYKTTLPVKKGLSSSAAFCVLVARSFNELYGLNLTKRAEIEAAYQGEIMTSSRCGRMDQGCAYGQIPVQMIFDGELLLSKPIVPGNDFHLLIGDLKRAKDTVQILADLNRAFPFPQNDNDVKAHQYLGEVNTQITDNAIQAMERGDAKSLGALMTDAQTQFDKHLMPFSTELQSPQLHKVLRDNTLKQWVFGGKGVGSQGDGCVQFVTKGETARKKLTAYLQKQYDIECFQLDLIKPTVIKKAVIPVAGNGTRMFPATKIVKKCFLPVITEDSVAKPIIQLIIEEALSGGVEEIGLIINPADEDLFRAFFAPLSPSAMQKLPKHLQQEAYKLSEIGKCITYIHQHEQKGLGHAILCADSWVADTSFMLLLGDHIYATSEKKSCARQVVDCYDELGAKACVFGIYKEMLVNVEHYGTVSGTWEKDNILTLSAIKEKPTHDHAAEYLSVEHNGIEQFFCVNGIYILTPLLFAILKDQNNTRTQQGEELQLTTALETLLAVEGCHGYRVNGKHFDTGLPSMFADTVSQFALSGELKVAKKHA